MSNSDQTKPEGKDMVDDVGRLIRHAGAREAVPQDRIERARNNVEAHWQAVVTEHRRSRLQSWQRPLAIAATIVLTVAVSVLLMNRVPPGPPAMATVDRVVGTVHVADQAVGAGDAIFADALIETSDDSRVALRLADGQSLRVDTASRLIAHSANRMTLERGAVYVDTDRAHGAEPVLVMTALGQARDIGTQFQVRITGATLMVGVREGQVEITRPDQSSVAVDSGKLVNLDAAGVSSERRIAQDDPVWNWVETVAPVFDIDGATLDAYLRWYAREHGLRLEWADQSSAEQARQIELSGSIAGTSLDDGLTIVQRIARFEHRIEADSLWVQVR